MSKQRLDDRKWTNAKGETWRVVIDLDAEKLRTCKSLSMIVNRAIRHPKGIATGMYGSIVVTTTKATA